MAYDYEVQVTSEDCESATFRFARMPSIATSNAMTRTTAAFKGAQSAETAWRYDSRVARLREKISIVEEGLAVMKAELADLLVHPPMYDLFNWSA